MHLALASAFGSGNDELPIHCNEITGRGARTPGPETLSNFLHYFPRLEYGYT